MNKKYSKHSIEFNSHSEDVFDIVLESSRIYKKIFDDLSIDIRVINYKGHFYNNNYIIYCFKKEGRVFNAIPEKFDGKDIKKTSKLRQLKLKEICDTSYTLFDKSRECSYLENAITPI